MVTLATCGCQLSRFVCVFCKKEHTSHYYMLPVYMPSLSSHTAFLTNDIPTYLPAYRLPVTTYAVFKECTSASDTFEQVLSERSAWCPKCVFFPGGNNPNGYICGSCKISSIDKLCTLKKADSCLKMLLELKVDT